jgi:hypothetical protein
LDSRGQEPEGKGAAWQRPPYLQRRQSAAASPRDLIDRLKDLLAGAWIIDPNTKKRIMEEIELGATPIISRSNFIQLSQTFSCFGRMRVKPGKEMLAGLEHQVISRMGTFGAQGVSNAFARLCENEA